MMKSLQLFLFIIVFYHIIQTILVYGLGWLGTFEIAMIKDLVWVVLIVGLLGVSGKKIKKTIKVAWLPLVLIVILLLIAVSDSVYKGVDITTMIVGIKYDIYPVIVLLGALLVGINRSECGTQYDKKNVSFVFGIVFIVVVGGLLWQSGKILFPEIFMMLGYGSIGDYVLGSAPPLWYRTGPGGVMRLQGLFAGPNNYGYFLVAFFAPFLVSIYTLYKEKVYQQVHLWLIVGLYMLSVGMTLSRGAIVGVGIQILIGGYLFFPTMRKWIWGCVAVGVVGVLGLTRIKPLSTLGHMHARAEGLYAFALNPRGYGLGSAGPSIHYTGVYLPENQYLQLLLDIGIIGTVLWLWIRGIVLKPLRGVCMVMVQKVKSSIDEVDLYDMRTVALLLGVIGLGVEALFLHVLEDSMVNYVFLTIVGLWSGLLFSTTKKALLEESRL